jgi:hypothetical protein
MAEKIALIDYQNINDEHLTALAPSLRHYNRILLFIGSSELAAKSQKPEPVFIKKMMDGGVRLDLIPIPAQGNNNLDLHLAYYLGKLLAEEPNARYVIATKDKNDFGPLIAHLQDRGIACERMGPPKAAKPVKAGPAAKSKPVRTISGQTHDFAEIVEALRSEKVRRPKKKDGLIHWLESRSAITAPLSAQQACDGMIRQQLIAVSADGTVDYKSIK